ncbi:hypothetical protein D3C76_705330 [compost metagenome]
MLIVLGWLVLVGIAGWFWFATIGGSYAMLGFTGKIPPAMVIPLAIACYFSYLAWDKFPWKLIQ